MKPIVALGLALVLAAAAGGAWYLGRESAGATAARPAAPSSPAAVDAAHLASANERFCGACHVTPDPAYFPAEAWIEEVRRGYRFFYESDRKDLSPPALTELAALYRFQATERLEFESPPSRDAGTSPFRRGSNLTLPGGDEPSVAHLLFSPSDSGPPSLFIADMGTGMISVAAPGRDDELTALAKLDHPAHVSIADLDSDGRTDLVVADLGSYQPEDHAEGRVVWLRDVSGRVEPVVLADKLGRVADVRSADFTGDGVTDLVVAEFGWLKTGRVLLLEGQGVRDGVPRFETRVLDDRHGAIHVPVTDLNGDGRPDFLALFAQEHETIEAFLNEGGGVFRREVVSPPQDPAFGSSGIELVDLDRDGDLDVLYTNGDMFDSHYLKPYHGVQWLENRGSYPFSPHRLATMPGVHRALAGDLDSDGDLDVAAASLHPENLRPQPGVPEFPSLLWLEQTEPGRFEPHAIEMSSHHHAALELGDFDADGDPDLAVGGFRGGSEPQPEVTIWWNEGQGSSEK